MTHFVSRFGPTEYLIKTESETVSVLDGEVLKGRMSWPGGPKKWYAVACQPGQPDVPLGDFTSQDEAASAIVAWHKRNERAA